jgi:hypothetical protein
VDQRTEGGGDFGTVIRYGSCLKRVDKRRLQQHLRELMGKADDSLPTAGGTCPVHADAMVYCEDLSKRNADRGIRFLQNVVA